MLGYLTRRYTWFSVAILALACFNVTFRLDRESVGEWDESLFATTAWEMTQSGELLRTTFDGTPDYYNTKPPLNVWILAATFSLLGTSLLSLRLPSAAFGWLTVWVLQRWTKRAFGPVVALFSSLVLASAFGFLHEHSARSGNADALLSLLLLLAVVVLWEARDDSRPLVWLGPILAGVFLLKGMAVLQPLLFVVIGLMAQRGTTSASRRRPLAIAAAIFLLSVGTWVVARWLVDGSRFFRLMLLNDLLGVSLTQLEGHEHGLLFYVDVLQRYHYEWLGAGAIVALVEWRSWPAWAKEAAGSLRRREPLAVIVVAWALTTFALPSFMQTRVLWYLNPFYPLFALLVGLVVARGLAASGPSAVGRRRMIVAAVVLALVVAESKSLWRLYRVTNLDTSVQGLLLAHMRDGARQRVFRDRHIRSEAFVVRALGHAEFRVVASVATGRGTLPPDARVGDLVVTSGPRSAAGLRLLGQADGHSVYRVE